MKNNYKVIISGGGTGGHIFPAIAIADELKLRLGSKVEILFVGAMGKMEMTKVPAHGYEIIGLDIRGIQRSWTIQNLWVPFRLIKSMWKAYVLVKEFKPDIAIGVGGYASGPLLQIARWLGIPYFIQEQNSYPGITNRILAKGAQHIFVAYDTLTPFFPNHKIIITGNPVRKNIASNSVSYNDSDMKSFGLKNELKTILIIGGSLGARSINTSIDQSIEAILASGYQLIWQTGPAYFSKYQQKYAQKTGLCIVPFIEKMDVAYRCASLIVSRAGALSISELCLIGKPVIFIPSPNVSEDHQTKNAMSLVRQEAAWMIADHEALEKLGLEIIRLMSDEQEKNKLSNNILKMAKPRATEHMADVLLKYMEHGEISL